jgi:hypothetical protein
MVEIRHELYMEPFFNSISLGQIFDWTLVPEEIVLNATSSRRKSITESTWK